jgi:hypothetical protein
MQAMRNHNLSYQISIFNLDMAELRRTEHAFMYAGSSFFMLFETLMLIKIR